MSINMSFSVLSEREEGIAHCLCSQSGGPSGSHLDPESKFEMTQLMSVLGRGPRLCSQQITVLP